MGAVEVDTIKISGMSDAEISEFLKKNGLFIKVEEAKKVVELLGRDPSMLELHIFNTEWSEHTSYKSSRNMLKLLPTKGKTVILGPNEDAGIIKFTDYKGESYGITISHESHNHPSQVVPYEGAATGIGGNVRDVLCMGSRVIACADPLRFGNPNGKNKDKVKYIANSVVDGIAGYGNPLGIPVIAGDIYMNDSYDDNCLVNVVTLGILKEKEIIHSAAPPNAEGYDVIIVGKATDNSGFGGAAFASVILDEDAEESNKGAVQVPDPFLKNVLIRATEAVFKEVRENNINIGFKDMGAGGIMCSTTELADAGNYGAIIDLDKIHTSMDIPDFIIANSETQERFSWISPPEFTQRILDIYNKEFELPNVAEGARAVVAGKITKEKDYIMKKDGKIVCNAPVSLITTGILYDREKKPAQRNFKEPTLNEPKDYNDTLLKVLSLPQVASKDIVYKHYDTEVQGLAVIRAGEADAGVMAPLPGCKAGIALSVDSNPFYSRINPKQGAINAVAECMRNIASVGATPYGMTDCLCYGNPEKPEQFNDFVEGVKGVSEAATNLYLKGTSDPVPFVSGNVSFYNESKKGNEVDPSAIIGCLGIMQDYNKAINMKIKKLNSKLFMIGKRKDELGGSAYYQTRNELGADIPKINYETERNMIYSIIDAIDQKLLLSCHDISDGGMVTTVSEMILGGEADGKIGAEINIDFSELNSDKALFSESTGFIFEAEENNVEKIKESFKKYNIEMIEIGKTVGDSLIINNDKKEIINLPISKLKDSWKNGYMRAVR